MNKLSEKEKNDLIFKLLKFMNPFLTSEQQKAKIKEEIKKVLE